MNVILYIIYAYYDNIYIYIFVYIYIYVNTYHIAIYIVIASCFVHIKQCFLIHIKVLKPKTFFLSTLHAGGFPG